MVKAISHLIHVLYVAEHVFTIIAYISTLYYSFFLYVAVIIVQHLHLHCGGDFIDVHHLQ